MALYIYHEGTGTLIDLSDRVFVVNDKHCAEDIMNAMSEGQSIDDEMHHGYRLDNYNMGNLFYGEAQ